MTIIPCEIDRANLTNELVLKDETIYFNTPPASGVGSPPAHPIATKFKSI
jgi:hypothetical protein